MFGRVQVLDVYLKCHGRVQGNFLGHPGMKKVTHQVYPPQVRTELVRANSCTINNTLASYSCELSENMHTPLPSGMSTVSGPELLYFPEIQLGRYGLSGHSTQH